MKDYKVEVLRFVQKGMDTKSLAIEAKAELQEKLDEYVSKGYQLTSTTAGDSGLVYLFFQKDM